jgi:hypothetical protein
VDLGKLQTYRDVLFM